MKGIKKHNKSAAQFRECQFNDTSDGEDSKDRDILKKNLEKDWLVRLLQKSIRKIIIISLSLFINTSRWLQIRLKKYPRKHHTTFLIKLFFFSKQFLCVWGEILKFLLPAIFYLKYSTVYTIYSLDMYKVLHSETEGEYGLFLSSSSEPH